MNSSKFADNKQIVGLVFWRVSVLWQRQNKDSISKTGITHTQFVILSSIEELIGNKVLVTQKEISDFSSIDPMTVSNVLKLLEKNKLIIKKNHNKDSRINVISITKKGLEIVHNTIPIIENSDNNFFFEDMEKNNLFLELLIQLKEKNEKF